MRGREDTPSRADPCRAGAVDRYGGVVGVVVVVVVVVDDVVGFGGFFFCGAAFVPTRTISGCDLYDE